MGGSAGCGSQGLKLGTKEDVTKREAERIIFFITTAIKRVVISHTLGCSLHDCMTNKN